MANWYAYKRNSDGKIMSYATDDSAGFMLNITGCTTMGPYATIAAAQSANEPTLMSPSQTLLNTLAAKASATWTLADLADWLKSKG